MPTDEQKTVEHSVIGCILLNASYAMPVLIQIDCQPQWFTDRALALLWSRFEAMYASGKLIDMRTAAEHTDPPELCATMLECVDEVGSYTAASHYADILRLRYLHRTAIEMVDRHARTLMQTLPVDCAPVYDAILEDWQSMGITPVDHKSMSQIAEEQIEEWERGRRDNGAVLWPLISLDHEIGTLTDELVYICAAESVGKTALVLQMLWRNGCNGITGHMASLESSRERIVPRILSQISGVNTLSLRLGKGTPDQFAKVRAAKDKLDRLPFVISDNPMTSEQMLAWGRTAVKNGAKYIIVDNTRHIRSRKQYNSPVEQMREVSLKLKWLRDDLRIPIIALHHANAEGDVSWSKDLRRDVDVLLMLRHNTELSKAPIKEDDFKGQWFVDIVIDKNRDGRKGFAIRTEFQKEIQMFKEVDSDKS